MQRHLDDLEDITEDDFLSSIDEEDFVFIVDKQGNLKTLLMPEYIQSEEAPANVYSILNVFGVSTINSVTLH
jgi:hypothetical protein